MKVKDFINRRKKEKEWLIINGFVNDNPNTNGEYKILALVAQHVDLFVDIGVNLGHFSKKIFEFNKNINIIGFEPNTKLNKYIKNIKPYKKNKMKLFNVALSNKKSNKKFYIHPNYPETASLNKRKDLMPSFIKESNIIETKTTKLDVYYSFFKNKKNLFIKIDVEGFEKNVINGSKKILKKNPPNFIMFEYSSGWTNNNSTFKEVFHLLDSFNYEMFRITPLGLEKIRFFTPEMETFTYSNYLAIKKGHVILNNFNNIEIEQMYGKSIFIPFK